MPANSVAENAATNALYSSMRDSVTADPTVKISTPQLNQLSRQTLVLDGPERQRLLASHRIHNTLFFERIVRAQVFTLPELITLHHTSGNGGMAVVKNINAYADNINASDAGVRTLETLLSPVGRSSRSTHIRSTKATVAAFTTRNGYITLLGNLTDEFIGRYTAAVGKTPVASVVDYVISVYEQEIYLSGTDKSTVLPRLFRALSGVEGAGRDTLRLAQFLDGRFNYRLPTN